jgi:dihydroorotase
LAQKLNGTALTAASGMPSVQFSLLVMLQLAREGVLSVETVVERMCAAPAQLFHVERRGALRRGYYADLVVVEPTPDYQISHANVVSRCGWTPYNGFTLSHRVAQTWVNGVAAYVDGQFTAANAARALTFAQ